MEYSSPIVEYAQGLDDINQKLPNEYWTLLQYAVSVSDVEAVTWLLSHKADTQIINQSKAVPMSSPLMIAVKTGNMDIINLLISKSDVNFQDQWGFAALHYAVLSHNMEALTDLLSHGAKALLSTKSGTTSLDLARELEYEDMIDVLKSRMFIEQDPTISDFRDWLSAVGAVEYLSKFLEAGYDLPFIVKYGLKEEDLDCVGIPLTKLGLRKKIIALHKLEEYYNIEEEENEKDQEEEEEEYDEDQEERQEEDDYERKL